MSGPRITVPTLFDGAWDSVLVCTYGADLAFYERDLWRQLDRAKNRIVFADARQVARQLADAEGRTQLRQINRTYVLAPMHIDRAAHAKLILLLQEDRGLLAVGSGNLGMGGYASQGECFTTYRWSEEDAQHLGAFIAAKDFIDEILDQGLVDKVVRPRVQQAWQDAPWIYGVAANASAPVRHNFGASLLDQLIEAIDGRMVDELVVHAPFYDHRCIALSELIERGSPQHLQVLLQEKITSVDPKRLAAVLGSAECTVDVRTVQAHENGTFLHAKFVIARCGDVAVCLQGSPNLSTPALLQTFPTGNIELANLLIGRPDEFDHLVADLVLSPGPVDIGGLGLGLIKDEATTDEYSLERCVRELLWIPPRLTGVFDQTVQSPPTLVIGEATVDDVRWDLHEPTDDSTPFTATLGERAAALLSRVDAVTFIFDSGEPSVPAYPFHLNTLIALASGQGRTDLLKQAGDFDIGDEELEQLLAQLDEVLVVDGQSIWRMLKRKAPEPTDPGGSAKLDYDDLDWDAIHSHPKLAQYRTWEGHTGADSSGLGILLGSIAERFRADVELRRSGRSLDTPSSENDPFEDLSATIEAEDEEAAEAEEVATERRRLSARARAKRQFHTFVKRFVNGLVDEDFVKLVGPSVIIPSYVVFNHLCWKLIQVDLADPMKIVRAQSALWQFFWGDPEQAGFLATMSPAEQEAALDILDRHHAEAVLLCSLFQAYNVAWNDGNEHDLAQLRDVWRRILEHPLWQPTKAAVADAATVLAPECDSAEQLVEYLNGLASFVTAGEPLTLIEKVVGARPGSVTTIDVRVRRGELGEQNVAAYVIEDPDVALSPETARAAMRELRSVLHEPVNDYIRIEQPSTNVVAFGDYALDDYVYADRKSDEIDDLERPEPVDPSWRHGIHDLLQLAG